jgi:prevent-host-death family protein
LAVERIGIRELKERTSEILRRVRQEGERFEVTYHGEPVAEIVPTRQHPDAEALARYWRRWDALTEEMSQEWPEGLTAVDALREDRDRL